MGFIATPELLFVIVVVSIGLIVGLVTLRDSTMGELSDTAEAFGALDQSHQINGIQNSQSSGSIAFQSWSDTNDTNAGDDVAWSFVNTGGLNGEASVNGGGDASAAGVIVAAAAAFACNTGFTAANPGPPIDGTFNNDGTLYSSLSSTFDIEISEPGGAVIDDFGDLVNGVPYDFDVTIVVSDTANSGSFNAAFITVAERTYTYLGQLSFAGGIAILPDTSANGTPLPAGASPFGDVRLIASATNFQWQLRRTNLDGANNAVISYNLLGVINSASFPTCFP
ncbi:MAG: hypothetical protein ACI8P9_000162 [Parasphingorhabdus sp.]|jgi:hypothetical protein